VFPLYFSLYSTVSFLQQKDFQLVKTLLFDGESGIRSAKAQKQIYKELNIKVHAEPFYKRNMAERAIKEIKLRMAIHLDFQGKNS
jgi:hypothetical protein